MTDELSQSHKMTVINFLGNAGYASADCTSIVGLWSKPQH